MALDWWEELPTGCSYFSQLTTEGTWVTDLDPSFHMPFSSRNSALILQALNTHKFEHLARPSNVEDPLRTFTVKLAWLIANVETKISLLQHVLNAWASIPVSKFKYSWDSPRLWCEVYLEKKYDNQLRRPDPFNF